jgi:hypothetical protein
MILTVPEFLLRIYGFVAPLDFPQGWRLNQVLGMPESTAMLPVYHEPPAGVATVPIPRSDDLHLGLYLVRWPVVTPGERLAFEFDFPVVFAAFPREADARKRIPAYRVFTYDVARSQATFKRVELVEHGLDTLIKSAVFGNS